MEEERKKGPEAMDTARWALNDNGPSISENQTCVMTGRGQLAIGYSNNKSLSSLKLGGTLFVGKGGVAESGANILGQIG